MPAMNSVPASTRRRRAIGPLLLLPLWLASACQQPVSELSDPAFERSGTVRSGELDEISGLQASHRYEDLLWTHNDDGAPRVYAMDHQGRDRGYFDLADAVNVDWEDMTRMPGPEQDILVLADIGDNHQRRSRIWLYLVEEPEPGANGRFEGVQPVLNWISLRYPDGPRDAESIAWDPQGQQLLILSKRDNPPRLYGLDRATALSAREADLRFLGEVTGLRPPTEEDRDRFGERTDWVSQPTALSIEGDQAALLTYRSLYLFQRQSDQDWPTALNGTPAEILGPASVQEEAISYSADGSRLWVTSEGLRAPLHAIASGAKSVLDPAEP